MYVYLSAQGRNKGTQLLETYDRQECKVEARILYRMLEII